MVGMAMTTAPVIAPTAVALAVAVLAAAVPAVDTLVDTLSLPAAEEDASDDSLFFKSFSLSLLFLDELFVPVDCCC